MSADQPRLPKGKISPESARYEVGYGKPPAHGQFQKGLSGNPKGRPKGAKGKAPEATRRLRDILLQEAYRDVTIREQDGPVSMTMAQAAIRSLAVRAAKGSVTAQKLLLTSLAAVEQEHKNEQEALWEAVCDYKHRMSDYLQDCRDHGRPEPELLPHPDDIEQDVRTGEVVFKGPVDQKDKDVWDDLWTRKSGYEDELDLLYTELENVDNPAGETILREDIARTRWLLDITELAIMMRWHLPAKRVTDSIIRQKVLEGWVQNDIWPERGSKESDLWEDLMAFDQEMRQRKRRDVAEKDLADPDGSRR